MADHAHGHQDAGHPDMDYRQHEATYEGFVRFSIIGTIWVVTVIVGLGIGTTSGRWTLATFAIFVSSIALAVGLFSKRLSWRPVAGMLGLMLLGWLVTG